MPRATSSIDGSNRVAFPTTTIPRVRRSWSSPRPADARHRTALVRAAAASKEAGSRRGPNAPTRQSRTPTNEARRRARFMAARVWDLAPSWGATVPENLDAAGVTHAEKPYSLDEEKRVPVGAMDSSHRVSPIASQYRYRPHSSSIYGLPNHSERCLLLYLRRYFAALAQGWPRGVGLALGRFGCRLLGPEGCCCRSREEWRCGGTWDYGRLTRCVESNA